MIEVEWWEADSADDMAAAVAGDVQFIIEGALDARGQAPIAIPGRKTPVPILERLAKAKLDWKHARRPRARRADGAGRHPLEPDVIFGCAQAEFVEAPNRPFDKLRVSARLESVMV